MAHLQYHNYEGIGKVFSNKYHYNQVVRVGDFLEIAGQGGWDPETGVFPKDYNINQQIDQAFLNVERALKVAGGKGFSQVFRIRTYNVPVDEDYMDAITRNFKKWFPDHKPVWTAVEISALALPEMKFEMEVSAHDPEGARAARK